MLRSINSLIGYSIIARDGEVGKLDKFFFDNKTKAIRYFVVEITGWLSNRKVLISPVALGNLDWQLRTFQVHLTLEQIRTSPEIDTKKPVSRQSETELFQHYHWPVYWANELALEKNESKETSDARINESDWHLQGTDVIMGVQAVDGEIGHVEDYILNSEPWAITALVVNTANWLQGKKILIPPQLIDHIDLDKKTIFVDLMQDVVEISQEFNPTKLVNTVYEAHLYDYYGRPKMESAPRTRLFG